MKMHKHILFAVALTACSVLAIGCSVGDEESDAMNDSRAVKNVSTFTDLKNAVAAAQAGDVIELAAGVTFTGLIKCPEVSGTATSRITIQTSATNPATLSNSGGGTTLSIIGNYWTVKNLKVKGGQKGIVFDNANYGQIINCEIWNTQMEAVHFRDGSDYGLIENSKIHDTGTSSPEYGEAIYVGTDSGSWGSYDYDVNYTTIRNCIIGPNVTAEHVDIKEGTIGTIVEYCTFNGTGISGANSANTFINDKAKDSIIRFNTGSKNGNNIITAFGDISNRGTVNSGQGGWWYNNTFNGASSTDYFIGHAQGTYTYFYYNNTKSPAGGNMYVAGGTEKNPGVTPTPIATVAPTATAAPSATVRPTATVGPTATAAPTATSTNVAGSIKVQYACSDNAVTTKSIKPDLKIFNTGSSSINLSTVKIRYYFTDDGRQPVAASPRYVTGVSSSNVIQSFGGSAGNRYLEISFSSSAGSIAAGGSVQIKATINDDNFEYYTQTGDYSYNSSASSYADSTKITAYLGGVLKWGSAPY